jgi:hypothetical protein
MRVTPGSGEFFRLEQFPASLRSWIQYDVPTEYRYYDAEEDIGHWYIHRKHLISVIELAYKRSGHVDYSALDDYLQIEVARAKEGWSVNKQNRTRGTQTNTSPLILRDAYATLHLLPSASIGIVTAVWRSLAKDTHPDRGGDAELFRRYSEAFSKIKEEEKK